MLSSLRTCVWWLLAANISRSGLRAGLLFVALGIGFHLATILQGLHSSIEHGVPDDPHLMVFPGSGSNGNMPVGELERMREIPGVIAASTHEVLPNLYYQEPENAIRPTAVIFDDYLRMKEIALSDGERECIRDTRMGALVSRALAGRYGWQVGDRIPIEGGSLPTKAKNPSWPFILCGIYDPPSPRLRSTFLMRKDYQIENNVWPVHYTVFQQVRVADGVDPLSVAREIDARFADTPYPTSTASQQEFERDWASLVEHAGTIVVSVSAAGVFSLCALFAAAAVQECSSRRREFASMRAVGFGSGGLSLLLLAENCILSFVAAAAGIAAAFALEGWYQGLLLRMFGLFALDAGAAGATLGIAGAAGLAAAAIPCAMACGTGVAREINAGHGG